MIRPILLIHFSDHSYPFVAADMRALWSVIVVALTPCSPSALIAASSLAPGQVVACSRGSPFKADSVCFAFITDEAESSAVELRPRAQVASSVARRKGTAGCAQAKEASLERADGHQVGYDDACRAVSMASRWVDVWTVEDW